MSERKLSELNEKKMIWLDKLSYKQIFVILMIILHIGLLIILIMQLWVM